MLVFIRLQYTQYTHHNTRDTKSCSEVYIVIEYEQEFTKESGKLGLYHKFSQP